MKTIESRHCVNCGKIFCRFCRFCRYSGKMPEHLGKKLKAEMRRRDCITCCKKCSREYLYNQVYNKDRINKNERI